MTATTDYSVRKLGDNYGLYFRGSLVESGVFAIRQTANKYKQIAENERRSHAIGAGPYCPFCRNARAAQLADPINFDIHNHVAMCSARGGQ